MCRKVREHSYEEDYGSTMPIYLLPAAVENVDQLGGIFCVQVTKEGVCQACSPCSATTADPVHIMVH